MNSLLWIEHGRLARRLSTVELLRTLECHCADYARYSYFSCAFDLVLFSLVIYADIKIQCSADNFISCLLFGCILQSLHNYWLSTS